MAKDETMIPDIPMKCFNCGWCSYNNLCIGFEIPTYIDYKLNEPTECHRWKPID